jgi:hypothetical protein
MCRRCCGTRRCTGGCIGSLVGDTSEADQKTPGGDPQKSDGEIERNRGAQRERIPGLREPVGNDTDSLVHSRVHQHREEQTPFGTGIEPSDRDRKRRSSHRENEKRLPVILAWNEKERKMPEAPDRAEYDARRTESQASSHARQSISAPSDLFAGLSRRRKDYRDQDDGGRFISESRPGSGECAMRQRDRKLDRREEYDREKIPTCADLPLEDTGKTPSATGYA